MNAIEVKNLSFSYTKDSVVFKDLSFEIKKGDYIILLGNNGSGKSTLARLLTGILKPNEGEIYIEGKKVDEKDYINNVSIVFQNPDNQFIATTVEEDIAFGLENKRMPKTQMQELVKEYAYKVHMSEYLKSEPSKLSGGQKQRVAIAGALVLGNNILILDEATSMLDPRGKEEILGLINELRKQNKDLTVISITHHINEIFLADKVMILDKGNIVSYDDPHKVFKNVNNQYLDSFLPFFLQFKKELINEGFEIKSDDLEGICKQLCQSK